MKKHILSILLLLVFFSVKSQGFHHHFIQYSSTGLNSSSGADVIDFNGDGLMDVLLGMEQQKDLLWIKNNQFTYTPTGIIDTAYGYLFVKTIDINDDGFDDFIVNENKAVGPNPVHLFLNDGNYNYSAVEIGNSGYDAVKHLEIGDLDGDMDNDIMFIRDGSNSTLYIYENIGGTSFIPHTYNLPSSVTYFGMNDFDANGVSDVYCGHRKWISGNAVYINTVLESDNSFGFTHHDYDTSTVLTAICDEFTGTGGDDIILGATSGGSNATIWRNDGGFNFSYVGSTPVDANTNIMLPLDYDGDGDNDFFSTGSMSWKVKLNNGAGSFSEQVLIHDYDQFPIAYVDIDGDNERDIIAHSYSVLSYFKNQGNNTFERIYTNYDEGNDAFELHRNLSNGRFGLAVANNTKVSVLNQSFDGLIELPIQHVLGNGSYSPGDELDDLVSYDKDNDGDLDLLCYISDDLIWMVNDNDTYTEEIVAMSIGALPQTAVGDLDGDGNVDIIAKVSTFFKRFEWNGSGYTETQITGSGGVGRSLIYDIDGDNDNDIVYITFSNSTGTWTTELRYLENNGGNFSDNLITTVSDISTWTNDEMEFAYHDINGNQEYDLFVLSPNDNNLVWIECTGGASFNAPVLVSSMLDYPTSMDFGDVNADGFNDIVVTSWFDGEIVLFENDGSQNFTRTVFSDDIAAPADVIVTDIDVDGDLDVCYSTIIDDRMGWFENLLIDCPRTYSQYADTVCVGDSVLFNNVYVTQIGYYYDSILNVFGCDSVVQFRLQNYNSPTYTISQNMSNLAVSSGLSNYQWFLNGNPVTGETSTSIDYNDYGNGTYQVESTTDDGCLLVSGEIDVVDAGSFELFDDGVRVFPNPARELLFIESDSEFEGECFIYNSTGVLMLRFTPNENKTELDISEYPDGVYLLEFRGEENQSRIQFVKL